MGTEQGRGRGSGSLRGGNQAPSPPRLPKPGSCVNFLCVVCESQCQPLEGMRRPVANVRGCIGVAGQAPECVS